MITRSVKFRRILDENIALRVRFVTTRGKVDGFVAQLESFINNKWHPIVRYDTAHDFAHQDILHPFDKAKKIELASQDYNEALTYAIQDLSENWDFYGSLRNYVVKRVCIGNSNSRYMPCRWFGNWNSRTSTP